MANWFNPGDALTLAGSYNKMAGQGATVSPTSITPNAGPTIYAPVTQAWSLGSVNTKSYTNTQFGTTFTAAVAYASGPVSSGFQGGADRTSGWQVTITPTPTRTTYHCRTGIAFVNGAYVKDYHDYQITTAVAVSVAVTVPGNPYRDNYNVSVSFQTTEPNVTIGWDAGMGEWYAFGPNTTGNPQNPNNPISTYNFSTGQFTYHDPGTTTEQWGLGNDSASVAAGAALTASAPNTDGAITHPGLFGVLFDWGLTPLGTAYSPDGITAYQFAKIELTGGPPLTDVMTSADAQFTPPTDGGSAGMQPGGASNNYSLDDTFASGGAGTYTFYGVWFTAPEYNGGAPFQIHPSKPGRTGTIFVNAYDAPAMPQQSGWDEYSGQFPPQTAGSVVTLDSTWQAQSTVTYHITALLPTDQNRAGTGQANQWYDGRPIVSKTLAVTLTTYTKVQQNVTPPGAPVAQTLLLTQDMDGRPCGSAAATLYSSKAPGPHGGPAFDSYPTGLGTSPADSSLVVDARTNQRLLFWADGTAGLYRSVANQDGEAGGWTAPVLVLAGAALTTVVPSPTDPDRLLLAAGAHLYESADGGQNWQSVSTPSGLNLTTASGRPALLCLGNHVGLAGPASSGNLVYVRSADGGYTWAAPVTVWTQPADTSSVASRVQSMAGHARDGALFLAALVVTNTLSGGVTTTTTAINVWVSGDQGATWQALTAPTVTSAAPGLLCLRGTHRLLWSLTQYSDTAGASWAND